MQETGNIKSAYRMRDKTVIITGAAGATGRAMVKKFAEEGANAALFLASDEASFINGVTLAVDGGMNA